MVTRRESTESKFGIGSRIGSLVGGLFLAIVVMYFGGWSLVWGQALFSSKAIVTQSNGFAIRFNELYYGAIFSGRFFDSPAISWLCLIISIGLISAGLSLLFGSGSEQ
jgi:hypothetical protein